MGKICEVMGGFVASGRRVAGALTQQAAGPTRGFCGCRYFFLWVDLVPGRDGYWDYRQAAREWRTRTGDCRLDG